MSPRYTNAIIMMVVGVPVLMTGIVIDNSIASSSSRNSTVTIARLMIAAGATMVAIGVLLCCTITLKGKKEEPKPPTRPLLTKYITEQPLGSILLQSQLQQPEQITPKNMLMHSPPGVPQAIFPSTPDTHNINQYPNTSSTENISQYGRASTSQKIGQYSSSATKKSGQFPSVSATKMSVQYPGDSATKMSVQYPGDSATKKSIQYPNDSATKMSVQYPSDSATKKSVKYQSDSVIKMSVQYPSDSATKKSIQYLSDSATKMSVQYPSDSATKKPIQYPSDSATKMSVQYPSDSATKMSVQYPSDSATKMSVQYPSDSTIKMSVLYPSASGVKKFGQHLSDSATKMSVQYPSASASKKFGQYPSGSGTKNADQQSSTVAQNASYQVNAEDMAKFLTAAKMVMDTKAFEEIARAYPAAYSAAKGEPTSPLGEQVVNNCPSSSTDQISQPADPGFKRHQLKDKRGSGGSTSVSVFPSAPLYQGSTPGFDPPPYSS